MTEAAEESVQGGAPADPRRWWILAILCGSLVLIVVNVSALNVALPAIQQALDASGSDLQWLVDSYALVFAGLLLPAGAIGDRYGRKGALVVLRGEVVLEDAGGVCPAERSVGSVMIVEVDEAAVAVASLGL